MASPWAKIQPIEEPVSLLEIISEQLANSLQKRELKDYQKSHDTEDDEVIAHILQDQFNREYNVMLKRTEEKFNRDSKVNITYANYQTRVLDDQDEKNTTDVDDTTRDFDRFVTIEKEYASIPRCGYKKMGDGGSQIVTKHDMLMCSRINACRVLQFPGIDTGDTGGFDVKLNNKVFNSLRAHSRAQCSREKAKTRPDAK